MFAKLGETDIHLLGRFLVPLVMLIHLLHLPYFVQLSELRYVDLASTTFGEPFRSYFFIPYFIYCVLGIFYFVKPKVLLPLSLGLCWFVQGTLMAVLDWHDQQAMFLTLLALMVFYIRPGLIKEVPFRKLVLLFLSLHYFGAGISKLIHGGLSWAEGTTLQFRFIEYHLLYDVPLGKTLATSPLLCKLLSLGALTFQISFPLCLFVERLEKFYVFSALVFISVVYLTLGITLYFHLPLYLVFLPWGKLRNLKGLEGLQGQY